MIDISKQAQEYLSALTAEAGGFLRLRVKSGGCAGMTYDAAIDQILRIDDVVIYDDGRLKVVAESASLSYMEGLAVEYSDDLIAAGIRFKTSFSHASCGCGASFTLAGFPEIDGEVHCGR